MVWYHGYALFNEPQDTLHTTVAVAKQPGLGNSSYNTDDNFLLVPQRIFYRRATIERVAFLTSTTRDT